MAMKTVISHFFNEEYLLPWWLKHHTEIFDHGILIDYNSTDRSVEIVKELAPDWTLVSSRNEWFGAEAADIEVMDYEATIEGWKIALNTTEFVLGDFNSLDTTAENLLVIPTTVMVDLEPDNPVTYNDSLVTKKPFGVLSGHDGGVDLRPPRAMHRNARGNYTAGRHFYGHAINCSDIHLLWYGWSPFTEETLQRKLQIQTRMPQSDKDRGFGTGHITTYEKLKSEYTNYFAPKARDLTPEINKWLGK